MKKDGLDIGALLIGTDDDSAMEEGEGDGEESAEVDHMGMKREAMGAFREALKGDDLDEQVRAFETMMQACGMSGPYSEED